MSRARTIEAGAWHALAGWFETVPGCYVARDEIAALQDVLPDLFGYHLIQIGGYPDGDIGSATRISHKVMCHVRSAANRSQAHALLDSDQLPFASASVDVVVLPHTIELAATPHALLREVERVLVGEGHVVIIGFNPASLWGLWRLLLAWRDVVPWNVPFFSARRVTDWLSLLGFDIVHTRRFVFRPPLRGARMNRWLQFLEKLGRYCWPIFGGVYLLVGRKRVVSATPLRATWKSRRQLLGSGVIEPSGFRESTTADRNDISRRSSSGLGTR